MHHRPGREVHEDVVQVPVAESDQVSDHGRRRDRPRVTNRLLQPSRRRRRAAPQLPVQVVLGHLGAHPLHGVVKDILGPVAALGGGEHPGGTKRGGYPAVEEIQGPGRRRLGGLGGTPLGVGVGARRWNHFR